MFNVPMSKYEALLVRDALRFYTEGQKRNRALLSEEAREQIEVLSVHFDSTRLEVADRIDELIK